MTEYKGLRAPHLLGFSMNNGNLAVVVDQIETANSINELRNILQSFIENKGFQSFSFIENELGSHTDPLILNTITQQWEDDYRNNDFVTIDPCLPVAQRTNTPFIWSELPEPPRKGIRKPKALKLMEAAKDHSLNEGLVIPFHFRDQQGVFHSSVCTLFWSSSIGEFLKQIRFSKTELHLILIYWAERVISLSKVASKKSDLSQNDRIHLTDREKDVLTWAAMGKTINETSCILGISTETANGYMKNAIKKLDAYSKTQAVVRAISEGFIRI